MNQTHYYFCEFNSTIPERIANHLRGDLLNRNSLVSICAAPSEYESNDRQVSEVTAELLDPAGLAFDEYHLIDYRVTKEKDMI